MKVEAVKEQGRTYCLDLLRAVACLLVVLLHVSALFVRSPLNSAGFWLGNLLESVSRAGVGLFVMLSGRLMLDENYKYTREKLKKHLLKLLVFYVFWSCLYALCFELAWPLLKKEPVDLLQVAWRVVQGHYHLWFIPMMMGLYLILPLLRLWVNKANIRYVRYFLILAVIFGFALPQGASVLSSVHPVFTRLSTLLDSWQIHYPVGFTAYFVLGWYLGQIDFGKKKAVLALVTGVTVTFAGTFLIRRFTAQTSFIFYEYLSLNVLLSVIGLFALFTRVYTRKDYPQGQFGKLVGLVSRHSLGIYATHVAVMTVANYILPQIHPAVNIPVLYIVSVAGALAASVILSKLPLLKKVV